MRRTSSAVVTLAVLFAATNVFAQSPSIVESEWTMTASITLPGAQSARFNPADGRIYAGTRGTATDGLYRINRFGRASRLAGASNVAGLAIDTDGDAFFSEDFGGVIYRVALNATARSVWASGFHAGDDDPIGLAIAPATHDGSVVAPGRGIMVDRGFSGPDEIWTFSTTISATPVALHADVGTLVDPVDAAFGTSDLFVVDTGEAQAGRIYRVHADGSLLELPTLQSIADPVGVAVDPNNGDLLITDAAADRLVRVSTVTGALSDVITGLNIAADEWASVAIKADGRQLFVTSGDAIYIFTRCAATSGGPDDCNSNGVFDLCDLALGTSSDCNQNQLPDECDLAGGASRDCNFDLVPDECPRCPPIEVVFFMDTSASMNDEAAALCSSVGSIGDELSAQQITLISTRLGIADNPGGAYSCLTGNVIATYGTAVPGNPPAGIETLGACPGGSEVASEDWGRATAVVAGLHPWTPGAARIVVPIADEGPWCGDPVRDPGNDRDSITHASTVAVANDVFVSPITGTGASAAVIGLAQDLAAATGGNWHASTTPGADLAESILDSVHASCRRLADCNDNGVPDNCDIAGGASADCNGNGAPDECETATVVCVDAGIADAAAADGDVRDDASGLDASGLDASGVDASGVDASGTDAGSIDATGLDATDLDGRVLDGAIADGASLDAGRLDAIAGADTGTTEEGESGCSCEASGGLPRAHGVAFAGLALVALAFARALRSRRR